MKNSLESRKGRGGGGGKKVWTSPDFCRGELNDEFPYLILKYESGYNSVLFSYYKIYVSIDLVIGVRQVLTFNYVHDKLSNVNILISPFTCTTNHGKNSELS